MLTPSDVHSKVFATVRLREGYDLGDVDNFLGEVETTLAALYRENEELRARPGTAPESAARIVGLAHETAERAVAAARQEAAGIVERARERAAAIEDEARRSASALLDEAGARHREATEAVEAVVRHGARLREGLGDRIDHMRTMLADLEQQHRTLPPLTPSPLTPPPLTPSPPVHVAQPTAGSAAARAAARLVPVQQHTPAAAHDTLG